MIIDTIKGDYFFSESDPLLAAGVRQKIRYISGDHTYVSLMEINPNGYDPGSYIEFAKIDMMAKDDRASVNAIGNAKRAVHMLVESFFELLGLKQAFERAKFPKKLEVIQQLEAFPTRLISSLNKSRNEVEHEYQRISLDRVEDFVEVAELFYRLCYPFLKRMVNSIHVGLENDNRDLEWLLNPFESQVSIIENRNSSFLDLPAGKVFYNFSEKKEDRQVLKTIKPKQDNSYEWLPYLNSLVFVSKRFLIPENPPYDPKTYERIMSFSSRHHYFDPDSVDEYLNSGSS
jgi:hypothetical protein